MDFNDLGCSHQKHTRRRHLLLSPCYRQAVRMHLVTPNCACTLRSMCEATVATEGRTRSLGTNTEAKRNVPSVILRPTPGECSIVLCITCNEVCCPDATALPCNTHRRATSEHPPVTRNAAPATPIALLRFRKTPVQQRCSDSSAIPVDRPRPVSTNRPSSTTLQPMPLASMAAKSCRANSKLKTFCNAHDDGLCLGSSPGHGRSDVAAVHRSLLSCLRLCLADECFQPIASATSGG